MRDDMRDELLAFAHGFGPRGLELRDGFVDGGVELLERLDGAMHEPDTPRALCVEAFAREEQCARMRLAD
ncbi:MAG TPA: hypothetical protein VF787_22015, partial [Thermoanaerobaculia bacterium]